MESQKTSQSERRKNHGEPGQARSRLKHARLLLSFSLVSEARPPCGCPAFFRTADLRSSICFCLCIPFHSVRMETTDTCCHVQPAPLPLPPEFQVANSCHKAAQQDLPWNHAGLVSISAFSGDKYLFGSWLSHNWFPYHRARRTPYKTYINLPDMCLVLSVSL